MTPERSPHRVYASADPRYSRWELLRTFRVQYPQSDDVVIEIDVGHEEDLCLPDGTTVGLPQWSIYGRLHAGRDQLPLAEFQEEYERFEDAIAHLRRAGVAEEPSPSGPSMSGNDGREIYLVDGFPGRLTLLWTGGDVLVAKDDVGGLRFICDPEGESRVCALFADVEERYKSMFAEFVESNPIAKEALHYPTAPWRASQLAETTHAKSSFNPQMRNTNQGRLLQDIAKWEASCAAAQRLKAICKEQRIHAYYFGGVCRSVAEGAEPRDIDVVVDVLMWKRFVIAIQGITTTRTNSFGGMKFKLEGMDVDAWALDNTWAFATGISGPASPTLLPETTFLNIESVVAMVWHPDGPWMFEKGFFDAMRTRTIEIQNPNTPCPALCVARIRKFESRGWKRGASVDAFLEYHFANGLTEGDIADETSRHYANHP